jgi:hypothetical protein
VIEAVSAKPCPLEFPSGLLQVAQAAVVE